MTHTFAMLQVSAEAYDEITAKLLAAQYDHAFVGGPGVNCVAIDMHGIGLTRGARNWERDPKEIMNDLMAETDRETGRRRVIEEEAHDLKRRLELAEHALEKCCAIAAEPNAGEAHVSAIFETAQDALAERTQAGTPTLADLIAQKDGAYEERNRLVSLLARLFPSGIAKTAIEGWSPEWENCVYIDLPTGQVSWHYHDREAHLFEGLPAYAGQWDGHDTAEKWRRVAALNLPPKPSASEAVTHLRDLVALVVEETGAMDICEDDADDDAVGISDKGPLPMTFGHVRRAHAALEVLTAAVDPVPLMAALAAAISLLERTPGAKKAAPSDRMFDQMLDDYRKALNDARASRIASAPCAEPHIWRLACETMREACAAEVQRHDKTGREWAPGSFWDKVTREATNRIRALPIPTQVGG